MTANLMRRTLDQALSGVSWAHVFSGPSRVSMVLAAIAGQDNAAETSSPYGRDYTGLRLSAAYPITHRFNLFASVGATDSDYAGRFFNSTDNRSDSQADVQLGASWRINKTWILNAAGQVEPITPRILKFSNTRKTSLCLPHAVSLRHDQ